MSEKRRSDTADEKKHARTAARTFQRDDGWYFSSREGNFGPFESQAEAGEQLDAYIQLVDLRLESEGSFTPD